jgi:glycosyltransferase involved in cell wall biosynthesis
MLRILFITHYFPPEGNAPASRVSEICRRWVKAGHEVTVITGVPNVPNGTPYEGYRNRLVQREVMDGIEVLRVWTYLAPNKGTFRRTLNYLSFMVSGTIAGLFARKPDLVLATSPQFFCGWAGALVSKMRRLPFVLEIRDIWPESIQAVGAVSNRLTLGLLARLERRLYGAAVHVVTVGEGYREKLLERGVPDEKISIVSNGVDQERFFPREAAAELKSRIGERGAFICSYVGTVGMASGLDVVLRAAAKLKAQRRDDIHFLIVGDGAALEELRRSAGEQRLETVTFTGRVPKDLVPDYIALSSTCLVHLRRQDLFKTVMPSKIFESLAMARPVILGVEGFAAEFLKRSGGGICIEPENADALLDAVERLRMDPRLGQAMAETGRNYVLKFFDRDKLAGDYLQLLERVLQGGLHSALAGSGAQTGQSTTVRTLN